jgi:polysaccharide biosynthesis transport protein
MDAQETTLDLRSLLKLLARRRWLIVATFLVVVFSTGLVTWRLTPIYESTARVEVQPTSSSSSEASRILESLVDPTRGLQTQVELVKSQAVLGLAAEDLGLPSTDELEKSLSVELLKDTQIVEIRVQHERPDESRDWANAIANAYITFRRERALETSLSASQAIARDIEVVKTRITEIDAQSQSPATATSARAERERAVAQLNALEAQLQVLPDAEAVRRGGGTIVSAAETPTVPVRPRRALNLTVAIVVGAILGLALAFLAENLDDRIKSPEEVEERIGAPMLGYIPLVKEWDDTQEPTVASESHTASGAAEAYRTLRTNLRFLALERRLRTVLVTGAVAEAGKSTCAANLAAALARGGDKVVLVSADLRRPRVHKFFGLTNSRGLVNALDPSFPLENALQQNEIPNLRILAAGGLPPNPTEILASTRFGQVLSTLKGLADFVVIDAPPVLGLGDSSALASRVDGILFVVRTGGVTKRELSHAADQLRKAGGQIIGCLLNAVESEEGYGYYYHYYYPRYQEINVETPLPGLSPDLDAAGEAQSETLVFGAMKDDDRSIEPRLSL